MSSLFDINAEGVNINTFQRSLCDIAVDEITSNGTNDVIWSTYAKIEASVVISAVVELFVFADYDVACTGTLLCCCKSPDCYWLQSICWYCTELLYCVLSALEKITE